MKLQSVAAFTAVLFATTLACALKPFQKEASDKFDAEVKASHDDAEKACGTKFAIKTNFDEFKQEDWAGNSVSSRCVEMFSTLGRECGKPAYKGEVVKRISEVQCLFGGKSGNNNEGTKANISVTGKAFVFKMHPDNVNLSDNTQTVLEKALNQ